MPNKRIVPNKSIYGGKSHNFIVSNVACKAQSEPVPAASRNLPSDKLYSLYQLLLTTKLGELVASLENCLASMCKLIIFFFNKRIVPNRARKGTHFSGNKYAYRDIY